MVKRDGKSTDRASSKKEKEKRRDDGGHVRVDDGQEGFVEAGSHGGRGGLAVAQFFADAFEDQNVGVHAHADGQDDAGDARQSKNRASESQGREQNDRLKINARTALAPERR